MPTLNADYWNQRYLDHDTPWDIGYVSTPLRHVFDKITDKAIHILIPGAGRAHEAIYLHQQGFHNVWVCDWAPEAFAFLRKQAPDFPESNLLIEDFFQLTGQFDLIVEQTFLSALPPAMRPQYVRKVWELQADHGYLIGVLFNEEFSHSGPPYGGNRATYERLFRPYFHLEEWHVATDSIAPRQGRELFLRFRKKSQPDHS